MRTRAPSPPCCSRTCRGTRRRACLRRAPTPRSRRLGARGNSRVNLRPARGTRRGAKAHGCLWLRRERACGRAFASKARPPAQPARPPRTAPACWRSTCKGYLPTSRLDPRCWPCWWRRSPAPRRRWPRPRRTLRACALCEPAPSKREQYILFCLAQGQTLKWGRGSLDTRGGQGDTRVPKNRRSGGICWLFLAMFGWHAAC